MDAGDRPEVGALVTARGRPEWGVGQVQSSLPGRVTVMFEQAGRVVLLGEAIALDLVRSDWL